MKNAEIINSILDDIRNMSLDELKSALARNSKGPIHQAVHFNPYETLYDCSYRDSKGYRLAESFSKNEFISLITKLDSSYKIAQRVVDAANDGNYRLAV
ncbi:hypothetical protein BZG05_01545 [Salinivibrio kushneri]|uniref:hypothetical protein n=1 Tax=Salinivibrio kushneri TaxID=1908198 RepID=UPI000988E5A8|nr:hypothetical protein [Salinivibrio kushneri]OOE36193.1 hypothetical protein BZG05_01545 [Salinivibrio kushneri]